MKKSVLLWCAALGALSAFAKTDKKLFKNTAFAGCHYRRVPAKEE